MSDTDIIGFYPGQSFSDYRAIPALNQSSLKVIEKSPAHFLHAISHPREPSASMSLGTTAHCVVLEPARFAAEFVAWTSRTADDRMSPRKGKAWDEFCATNAGKTIVTPDEMTSALAMQTAVRSSPAAMRYLCEGHAEVSMVWRHDEVTGRLMKGRADWLTCVDDADTIVGLKTTRDPTPRRLARHAFDLGYQIQWPWYQDGFERLTGRIPRIVEIVVESAAPWTVSVYRIPGDVLDLGRIQYRALLAQLTQCEIAGEWPGPIVGETDFQLPPWAYAADEMVITAIEDGET